MKYQKFLLVLAIALGFAVTLSSLAPPVAHTSAKLLAAATTATPPVRGTYYDGGISARVAYPHRAVYDSSVSLTIEAWVYREDADRKETILSHDSAVSYWLGFQAKRLRFYRGGGNFADSTVDVQARQWTHVAASYNGLEVRFYVDGKPAGSAALANAGAGGRRWLQLGGEPSGRNFHGYLDEVRLWSVARTEEQIREGMFLEHRSEPSLAAVFASGGWSEDLTGLPGVNFGGTSQSVRGILPRDLTVPLAAIAPKLDGKVNLDGEYAGAEQLVIRYSDGAAAADAVAYLVHTEEDLFIGVKGLRDTPGGWPQAQSWLGLLLDTTFSREALAQRNHAYLRVFLDPDPAHAGWLIGDGAGGYGPAPIAACPVNTSCPFAIGQTVAKSFNDDADTDGSPTVELRIAKQRLGEWTETDGLALGHFSIGGAGDDRLAPGNASANSPATWARVSYSEASGVNLPRVTVSGHVYDGALSDTSHPIKQHSITLISGSTQYNCSTAPDGSFVFSELAVPIGAPVRLISANCGGCIYSGFLPGPGAPLPTETPGFPYEVTFPACAAGASCSFPSLDFFIQRPTDRILLDYADPPSPLAPMILVDNPFQTTEGSTVTIYGKNLHHLIEVYLSPHPSGPAPAQWVLDYRAEVLERAPDLSWIKVKVPNLPSVTPIVKDGYLANSLDYTWRWIVHDSWRRPFGYKEWSALPDPDKPGAAPFRLAEIKYPLIHGFGFENEADEPGFSEFLATYGNSAYICVGVPGYCATRIPDPIYWEFWWYAYKEWIKRTDGSCVGMAATSLLMRHELLQPEQFNSGIHFPAGFTTPGKPAEFEDGSYFRPPTAKNLWAEIRKNHGVQTSAEFLLEAADDLDIGLTSISGSPRARLTELYASPAGYVLSMVPEPGKGHAVSPYAVEGNRIWVYDNNHPKDAGRYIDIDPTANEYEFPGKGWKGTALFTIPLRIWRNSRTAPIDLPNLVYTIVLGGADGLYTRPDGASWGWHKDGSYVDAFPGAKAIFPLGLSETTNRAASLLLPVEKPASNVQVNARGGDYLFNVAQGGRLFQLEALDSVAGDTDYFATGYVANRLTSFTYNPQRANANFLPRIGMILGDRQRAVFNWSKLALPAGGKVEFKALSELKGVEFSNNSGGATRHYLYLDSADGATGATAKQIFGPFEIPTGATHRTVIHNWPTNTTIRSQVDLNRDGIPDQSGLVSGRSCKIGASADQDCNRNGLLDDCDIASGASKDRNQNGVPDECEPQMRLGAVSLNPAIVTGGAGATGTVTLRYAAPAGGATIALSSNNPGVASVPASIVIPAGATKATFKVATKVAKASTAVLISASYSGATKTGALTVNPAIPR